MGKYSYDDLYKKLHERGLEILTDKKDYIDLKHKVVISNGKYKTYIRPEHFVYSNKKIEPYWFGKNNPFILDNINIFLKEEKNGNFICLSDKYIDRNSLLNFQCVRCGQIFKLSWFNASRKEKNHRGIICKNCDEHLESLHASILKQMFLHYYPDSIVEERSCENPNTGKIMPTDIVNHRLKIAIEIQGQFHEHEKQKVKDKIKKDFWIDKGYAFYDYKIEGVSILDYIKLFFPDIDEIPYWVNFDYAKKINIKKAQQLLNNGMKITEISKKLNVTEHRLYDAIRNNKLYYPKDYKKSNNIKVVKLDLDKKYMETYDSYREAERQNNIKKGVIISAIFDKRYYAKGFYWIPEKNYLSGDYSIPARRDEKFESPVAQYDMKGKYIKSYQTIKEAAKENNTISFKIYEVATGKRKSVNGFKYNLLI